MMTDFMRSAGSCSSASSTGMIALSGLPADFSMAFTSSPGVPPGKSGSKRTSEVLAGGGGWPNAPTGSGDPGWASAAGKTSMEQLSKSGISLFIIFDWFVVVTRTHARPGQILQDILTNICREGNPPASHHWRGTAARGAPVLGPSAVRTLSASPHSNPGRASRIAAPEAERTPEAAPRASIDRLQPRLSSHPALVYELVS